MKSSNKKKNLLAGMQKRGRGDDELFVDSDEGKTHARIFEHWVNGWKKDVEPPALSSPCEGTFEAVVMEYRKKNGG
ncbi:hypothetical protein AVEN_98870-1 [Araneus ventricosus]|uniref:Uncharacterized protein n=1 Tax=Araneus ventricosus TaxID=182803 RepID=A0A4Y2FVJ6_ARAVE|nr:hypothetical protein AVEN_98870-1 [Araneus ventricosus]